MQYYTIIMHCLFVCMSRGAVTARAGDRGETFKNRKVKVFSPESFVIAKLIGNKA